MYSLARQPLRIALVVGLVAVFASAMAVAAPEQHTMVRYWIDTPADQAFIDQNHPQLDIATGRRGEYYDIVVPNSELADMLGRGGRVEVLQEDLEEFYAARLGSREGFGAYHTYSEAVAWMDDLHAQYPQVISARWSIGQGHLGNDIWCFRVSDNPETDEEGETEVLFDALHHAREVMSSEMVMMLAEHLGQQYAAGTPDIVTLLDANEIYMVPIVNPDGFLYNEQTNPNGGGMWRKNRRNNGDGTWGVDPNRNYPYEWGCSWGSSGDPGSDTYRGPAPASEPEVQAMIALVNSHDFVTRQSIHTYGELTLYPWGYTTDDTPDHTVFVEMASAMVQFNGYTAGQPGEVLYEVCGGNFDWDYGQQDEHTKIFAFTNEIGNSSDGFWPSDARRQDLFDDNLWPSLYMIQISASLRGVTFLHDPVPFSTDEVQDYAVTTVPEGFEGTAIDQGSVALHYRLDGGDFTDVSMEPTGTPGEFGAAIPAQPQGTVVEYYLYATDVEGRSGSSPRHAPNALHYFEIGREFTHEMEADRGWTTGDAGDDASTGLWVRVDPVGTTAQPENDHSDPGTFCWVTGQHVPGETTGFNDVDSGKTTLFSPVYDLTGAESVTFGYWKWYSNSEGNDPNSDWWDVYLSNDGGQSWSQLEHTMTSTNAWVEMTYNLFDYFTGAGQVQLKFVASDEGSGSLVEAAVDDFLIAGVFQATGVQDAPIAMHVKLEQNFPNPFNPQTTIRFRLPAADRVELGIYDVKGMLIRSLLGGELPAGEHGVSWNGLDALGRQAASGVYFCKLSTGGGEELTRRMVLMK
jgi:hypothetical protein